MVNQKISEIAQTLWDLNENKLIRNVDYKLDLHEPVNSSHSDHQLQQNHQKRYQSGDAKPLITYLNVQKILSLPTYRTFLNLFDNYTPDTSHPEEENQEELNEQSRFLNAVINTPLMKEAHQFLVNEGKVSENIDEFKEQLQDIWFDFYSRTPDESVESSSAFEHVFIGEEKGRRTVLGCHNWLDYYYLQRKGTVSYIGYIPSDTVFDDVETDDPGVIAIRFSMNEILKPMGGFLVGLSPEFELALYTIIFLCGGQKTRVQFANLEIEFNCYKMNRNGKTVIGTLFPSI